MICGIAVGVKVGDCVGEQVSEVVSTLAPHLLQFDFLVSYMFWTLLPKKALSSIATSLAQSNIALVNCVQS